MFCIDILWLGTDCNDSQHCTHPMPVLPAGSLWHNRFLKPHGCTELSCHQSEEMNVLWSWLSRFSFCIVRIQEHNCNDQTLYLLTPERCPLVVGNNWTILHSLSVHWFPSLFLPLPFLPYQKLWSDQVSPVTRSHHWKERHLQISAMTSFHSPPHSDVPQRGGVSRETDILLFHICVGNSNGQGLRTNYGYGIGLWFCDQSTRERSERLDDTMAKYHVTLLADGGENGHLWLLFCKCSLAQVRRAKQIANHIFIVIDGLRERERVHMCVFVAQKLFIWVWWHLFRTGERKSQRLEAQPVK